tara:strand:- start:38 stop:571 length:534 start_codon:yes stop_codon:yes gene_type:complete
MILDYLISFIIWYILLGTLIKLTIVFFLLWDKILLPLFNISLFLFFIGVIWGVVLYAFSIAKFIESEDFLIYILIFIPLAVFLTTTLYSLHFGYGKKPDNNNKQSSWDMFWNGKNYEEPLHKQVSFENIILFKDDNEKTYRISGLGLAFICVPLAYILPITFDTVISLLSLVSEALL